MLANKKYSLHLVSSPRILLHPSAPCLVTQLFFFKMADSNQDNGNRPPTVPTKRSKELTGEEATIHPKLLH